MLIVYIIKLVAELIKKLNMKQNEKIPQNKISKIAKNSNYKGLGKRNYSNINANINNKDKIYRSKELSLLEILNLILKKRHMSLVSKINEVVKSYIRYLENKYSSSDIILRTIVSLKNSSGKKLEFPIGISHDISDEGLEILTLYIIQNIKDQRLRIVNSEITRENFIVQLEFKYEIYEPNLLESSFNPLFFIKSLNIKTIIKKIKELIKNIKNIINKASPVDLLLPIFPSLTSIDIPIPKIPVEKPIDISIKLINNLIQIILVFIYLYIIRLLIIKIDLITQIYLLPNYLELFEFLFIGYVLEILEYFNTTSQSIYTIYNTVHLYEY